MRFSEVIGLQDVKLRLAESVNDNRISHAQLYSGSKGAHGFGLALAYATYLMCENRSGNDSCGMCSACLKNDKLVHPDLHFSFPVVTTASVKEKPKSSDFLSQWRYAAFENPYMELDDWYEVLGVENKQGFLSVEEASDIVRKMSLKSFESKFKVLIMWMPEKMRKDTSNKLLKTLEEPPDNTVFLLVTEDPEQLLPTIRSRTQLVRTPVPDHETIAGYLVNRYALDRTHALKLARLAAGNLGAAIRMAREHGGDSSSGLEDEFMNWMRLCYNPFFIKDDKLAWNDLNLWIDDLGKKGKEYMKRFFAFCSDAARDCMLLSIGTHQMARFDDSVIPGFSKFSRFIHKDNIERVMELLSHAAYAVERNANTRILLLDLSFKMNKILNPRSS
jgi:DNA polymerase-3 subunit delta'